MTFPRHPRFAGWAGSLRVSVSTPSKMHIARNRFLYHTLLPSWIFSWLSRREAPADRRVDKTIFETCGDTLSQPRRMSDVPSGQNIFLVLYQRDPN